MVIEKILGNLSDYPVEGKSVDRVLLEWYEMEKKLLRKTTDHGEDIGIRLENSAHLKEGDVLWDDGSRLIVVSLMPCELSVVSVSAMKDMGRLCFELGNRHLSLSIGENEVRVPYDEPTFEYLTKLGFSPVKKTEAFTNVTVCHAHGHSHTDEAEHHHGA